MSFILLVLILFSGLFLSVVISNSARDALLTKQQDFAAYLAANLNHQIFRRFTLPVIVKNRSVGLRNEEQYAWLNQLVKETVHGQNVQEINIYDESYYISFSTVQDNVGLQFPEKESVKKALTQDTPLFEIIGRPSPFVSLFRISLDPGSVFLKTTYSMRTETNLNGIPDGVLMGVVEFTQDITGDYQQVIAFQRVIIALSVLSSFVLFFVLHMVIRRADRMRATRLSEKARLERELLQHEKLVSMGRMVASIAHEIRNPLGIIRSSAELLLKRQKDADPMTLRITGAIYDESKRLSQVVNDFLDYARPKAPRNDQVVLDQVVKQALVFMEHEFRAAEIEVQKEFRGKLTLTGDPDLLYRAVYNLLSNAMQAIVESRPERTQKGGDNSTEGELPQDRIAVSARPDGEYITLEISDTGPGFDPGLQEKLLDPFFTTKDNGTGLGLAIVNNIVKGHRGTLTLDNNPEGGALIRITLPR